ncbi:CBS domain-containing protein [Rhizobium sp.]|uniref:CBS domain-containing protein n=1 Tax=Rhizobium sp. TaxID=391 RepID=UPI0028AC3865
MRVQDVMSTRLVTISPEHSVWHAAQIMLTEHVSGLPVLDDAQALIGMVTEGDLLRRSELGTPLGDGGVQERARAYVKSRSWKVGALMSAPVLSIDEDAPLSQVAMLLGLNRIKRLPVLRDARLVGIVSRADLLKVISAGGPDAEIRGDAAVSRALRAAPTAGTPCRRGSGARRRDHALAGGNRRRADGGRQCRGIGV